MILQVGVKVFLKNKEGKYLLIKRSALKYPEAANQWDIVGGRIDPGSTLMENLRREVREETGLEIVSQPRLVAAQDILGLAGKHIVRLSYVADTAGKISLDTAEHVDYRWLSIVEMKNQEAVDKYVAEILAKGLIEK